MKIKSSKAGRAVKRPLGRPKGVPRPGSGWHTQDFVWAKRGWVVLTEAAKILGLSPKVVRGQTLRGELVEHVHWQKPGASKVGPLYFNRKELEVLAKLAEDARRQGAGA